MATNNNGREERKKRIMERGSDRMALITGRIQNIPLSPPPSPASAEYHHSRHESLPSAPSPLPGQHYMPTQFHKNGNPEDKNDASDTSLLKYDSSMEVSRGKSFVTGNQTVEPQIYNYDTSLDTMRPSLDQNTMRKPSAGTSLVQMASVDAKQLPEYRRQKPTIFSSRKLNSCILSSENTRASCSLVVALLVVLSYVDYPLLGINIVNSESIVASRPLYIVLLTDITIVLARLYIEKAKEFEEAEEERSFPNEDGHSWTGAVKVLERGLVVYQAIRGVFIDFSVYVVVVICGISLV
ncbi:putative Transmembrane protein [Quillaja saponaria]|uniref:Transmembrane protein n=1 Tax=Quillaja saponaria TaxID=32244 RepID=A0AAD7LRF2_QUISA|nr:putative Transmembrane protein [Quillaja saponaria]